ncbi:S8 family serine peptidase [bacterium]|nr:S8 family serine peptidase [bacterium]
MYKNILTIIFMLAVFVEGQVVRLQNMNTAIRDNGNYYAWIYFVNKVNSNKKPSVSEKTLLRRSKVNSNKNYDWYDLNPSDDYINKVLNTGAKLRHQSRWLNAISIECSESELIEISYMPFVKEIKPVNQFHRKNLEESQPNRSLQKIESITEIDYGLAREQLEQINVHKAHEAEYFGQGVTVLMLDTGYNLVHPVFDSLNIIAEWDFINNDSTTKNEDGQDSPGQHNHGTSTFSVLGGYAPGSLIGPAFKADFLLAKTEILDQEIQIEEDNFVCALEWGEALGADIASSSLGYTDWYTWENMDGNTAVTTKAVDIAVSLGMICVNCAGNENGNAWNHIIAPADADNVISVGAVNNLGIIAGFSSRGPSYDERIKPEVSARGVATACASGNGTSYAYSSGTSLATPLVAGAAAVLLSAHTNWTPMMVKEALMKTASQSNSPDNTYGFGIIDVWAAIKVDETFLLSKVDITPMNVVMQLDEKQQFTVVGFNNNDEVISIEPFWSTTGGSIDQNGKYTATIEGDFIIKAIFDGHSIVTDLSVGIIPEKFDLYQNYPNPFNSTTTIEYDLKQNTHVELIIYDILGRKIIKLADYIESPGKKRITWNGTDGNGNPVSTGIYICNLILDECSFTKKMLMIK